MVDRSDNWSSELYKDIPHKSFKQFYLFDIKAGQDVQEAKLGEGAFGIVFRAMRKSDKKRLAQNLLKGHQLHKKSMNADWCKKSNLITFLVLKNTSSIRISKEKLS